MTGQMTRVVHSYRTSGSAVCLLRHAFTATVDSTRV
jgi:hypothetical protein